MVGSYFYGDSQCYEYSNYYKFGDGVNGWITLTSGMGKRLTVRNSGSLSSRLDGVCGRLVLR